MLSRRLILRTAYDILVLLTVLLATAVGGWRLLRSGMGLSVGGAAVLFVPTALTTVLAAIYGYAVGWQRYYLKHERVLDFETPYSLTSPNAQFDRSFHRFVYGMLIAIPSGLAMAFAVLRDDEEATVFGVLSMAIAVWSIPRIQALRTGSE